MVSLEKLPIYFIRIEFQIRGSPHVHFLLWADNVPKLTEGSKGQYIQHVDSVTPAIFPSKNDNLVLRKLIKKIPSLLKFQDF